MPRGALGEVSNCCEVRLGGGRLCRRTKKKGSCYLVGVEVEVEVAAVAKDSSPITVALTIWRKNIGVHRNDH